MRPVPESSSPPPHPHPIPPHPNPCSTQSLGRGQCDDTLARIGEVRGELCCFWGRQDPHVDGAGRRVFYDALTAAARPFEWHEFNAAHAFMRDEGGAGRYNPELAALSFQVRRDGAEGEELLST